MSSIAAYAVLFRGRRGSAVVSMRGRPKRRTAQEKRRRVAVRRNVGIGLGSELGLRLRGGEGGTGDGLQRSGKRGGRKAKIITQAERPTPSPTKEPSCARPGKPPKLRTRN